MLSLKNFDGLHGKMADEIFLHASGLHDEKNSSVGVIMKVAAFEK